MCLKTVIKKFEIFITKKALSYSNQFYLLANKFLFLKFFIFLSLF